MPDGLMPNRAFRGIADASFEEVSQDWGLDLIGSTTALIAVDLDNDGDEDIVTNNIDAEAVIFENRSVGDQGLGRAPGIRLAARDSSGSMAIGSRITVRQGNWRRTFALQPVTGFQSCVVAPILVGLPAPEEPYDLEVRWPNGDIEVCEAIRGDRDVLAKACPPPSDTHFIAATPKSTGFVKTLKIGSDRYSAFDADPLNPVYPFEDQRFRPSDIAAQLQLSTQQLAVLWSKVDSALLTSVEVLPDESALLTGLWCPVLRITKGKEPGELAIDTLAPEGLWFGIIASDRIPGQYILANIGLNTLLSESPQQGVELHVADFDRNGEVDPILVRVGPTGRTTLLGLDALAGQMPSMRRFFSSYLPFSASRFDRLFPPVAQLGGRVYAATELRNHVYDAASNSASPLSFELQVGTPTSVSYTPSTQLYTVGFRSPPLRPELMAYTTATVRVRQLR